VPLPFGHILLTTLSLRRHGILLGVALGHRVEHMFANNTMLIGLITFAL
jgi:hypothetical protein